MTRIFLSPSKYVQGPGELDRLGEYARTYSGSALVVITAGGMRRFGDVVAASLEASGVSATFDVFGGECSRSEVSRLVGRARKVGAGVIVGIGGGKVFDTSKEVAEALGAAVIIAPTIAATDAPCSSCSVIYTDEGEYESVAYQRKNPDLVLVDSRVIAASPVRLTVSGMGDALATYFEARATRRSDSLTPARGKATGAALALARHCYETLLSDGPAAKASLEAGALTECVEHVIEANTLASGLGFESGGLAVAHAVYNGLTVLPGAHACHHGEQVAFGTIAQLVMEDAVELDEVMDFCVEVGLPVTFEQLGIGNATSADIERVAAKAADPADTAHNMPLEVTADMIAGAMRMADALGRRALQGR